MGGGGDKNKIKKKQLIIIIYNMKVIKKWLYDLWAQAKIYGPHRPIRSHQSLNGPSDF